jgi:outer membrane receptor for ferric coprogen and ferric-rhodotorulic acid
LLGVFASGIAPAQNTLPQTQPNGIADPAPQAANEEETTLPEVTVTAESERETLTESTGSYTTGATTTTTKLPLTLRETPQSITVITRQQMDDFALGNLDDVLRAVSGIMAGRASGNTGYSSRGFDLQMQTDGMPRPQNNSGAVSTDSAFFDHVEIQHGAAGLLTGAGEPGGTINMVRKRPTEAFQASIEALLGSWDRKRLVGDISTPLVESGVLKARFVAVSDEAQSFVDYVNTDKKGFYGVLELAPNNDTRFGIGVQYQKNDDSGEGYGSPTWGDNQALLSRSTFYGDVKNSFRKHEETQVFSYLEQALGGEWALKVNLAHQILTADSFGGMPCCQMVDPATGDGLELMYIGRGKRKLTSNTLDAYASGPLELFGRRHELAFGLNGYRIKAALASGPSVSIPYNIYAPPITVFPVGDVPSLEPWYEEKQHGVFGAARINVADPLKIIIGARASWYKRLDGQGQTTMEENAEITPYAGIVYDLNRQFSLYASYSDIFKPQTAMDRTGSVLEPVVGANYEVGVKGEFFNKRLNAAAALFRLEQTNLAETDEEFGISPVCDNDYCSKASGKVISEGVDLSLNGALSSHWNIGAGYTYIEAKRASGADKGETFSTRLPRHTFRLFTAYRVPGTAWTVGGNVRAQSTTYNSGVRSGMNWRIEQKSYALVGLTANYRIDKQADINVVVNNLFDKTYWTAPLTPSANFYGEPRNIYVNFRYQF